MNIWPQAGIISLLISLVCSEDLFASCEVGGLEAADPWRAPICGSRPQRCQAKIEGFLQLQSMGQGSTSDQRLIQNMSSPEPYLFFIRMMYMINVALFAEVSCQSLAVYLFFFSMQPWERSHWILEREWLRKSENLHLTEKWLGTAL